MLPGCSVRYCAPHMECVCSIVIGGWFKGWMRCCPTACGGMRNLTLRPGPGMHHPLPKQFGHPRVQFAVNIRRPNNLVCECSVCTNQPRYRHSTVLIINHIHILICTANPSPFQPTDKLLASCLGGVRHPLGLVIQDPNRDGGYIPNRRSRAFPLGVSYAVGSNVQIALVPSGSWAWSWVLVLASILVFGIGGGEEEPG